MKLFRGIREDLAESGKLKTYALYALGEIILVVLGILIALQIDGWNQERKDLKLEQDYYCRLLEDVQQDQLMLKELLEDNELRIKSSNELLHLVQKHDPARKAVITAIRNSISKTTFTFKTNQAAYEDIKSSGSLNILKDIALKAKLSNYYSTMTGLADVVDVNSDATVSVYYNVKNNFIEMGWPDLPNVDKAIDTTLVDKRMLQTPNYPSPELRKELTSEAIFFLGTNVRKKALYQDMVVEVDAMKEALMKKCALGAGQ